MGLKTPSILPQGRRAGNSTGTNGNEWERMGTNGNARDPPCGHPQGIRALSSNSMSPRSTVADRNRGYEPQRYERKHARFWGVVRLTREDESAHYRPAGQHQKNPGVTNSQTVKDRVVPSNAQSDTGGIVGLCLPAGWMRNRSAEPKARRPRHLRSPRALPARGRAQPGSGRRLLPRFAQPPQHRATVPARAPADAAERLREDADDDPSAQGVRAHANELLDGVAV